MNDKVVGALVVIGAAVVVVFSVGVVAGELVFKVAKLFFSKIFD